MQFNVVVYGVTGSYKTVLDQNEEPGKRVRSAAVQFTGGFIPKYRKSIHPDESQKARKAT